MEDLSSSNQTLEMVKVYLVSNFRYRIPRLLKKTVMSLSKWMLFWYGPYSKY